MRLLFVSNYYPPFARGGYEQWCAEVAAALVSRGHDVHVLTSKVANGPARILEKGAVLHRLLNLEVVGGLWQTAVRICYHRRWLEAQNLNIIRSLISDLQPDVAMIWGMWNVPRSVPAMIEQLLPTQTVYYFCDYWPTLPSAYVQQLQNPARSWVTHLFKRKVGRIFLPQLLAEPEVNLRFPHPICVSRAVRDRLIAQGVPIGHAQVIYGGTQVDQFLRPVADTSPDDRLKLLYVGRLSAEKDVMTAIAAMEQLKGKPVTLRIVGSGDSDYEAALRARVEQQGLAVCFQGRVPCNKIPSIMAQHDVLLFTSRWPEPFARTVLEAMAAGLVVVGTTSGGTSEILFEEKTGLTFPVGDTTVLTQQVQRLIAVPGLQRRLAQAAQAYVHSDFVFTRMVDEIESSLCQVSDTDESVVLS